MMVHDPVLDSLGCFDVPFIQAHAGASPWRTVVTRCVLDWCTSSTVYYAVQNGSSCHMSMLADYRSPSVYCRSMSPEHSVILRRGPSQIPFVRAPCVTFRRAAVSLWSAGQSPVLPFACCVGSLRSDGRCILCGVVSTLAEPSSWRTWGCAVCCGGCLTVSAAHSPPRLGRPLHVPPPPPAHAPAMHVGDVDLSNVDVCTLQITVLSIVDQGLQTADQCIQTADHGPLAADQCLQPTE